VHSITDGASSKNDVPNFGEIHRNLLQQSDKENSELLREQSLPGFATMGQDGRKSDPSKVNSWH